MIKNQCKGYLEYFEGEDETKEEPELNDDTIESLGNAETEHEAAQSAAEIAAQLNTAAAEQARANAAATAKMQALDQERQKASNELAQEAKKLYGNKLSAYDFKKAFDLTAVDVEKLRNDVTKDMTTNNNSPVKQYVTDNAAKGSVPVKINERFSLEIPADDGTMSEDKDKNKAWFNYHMSRELLKKTVEKGDNLTPDMKQMAARIIIEDALTKGTLDAFKNADPGDFGSQADIDDYTKNLKTSATVYENAAKEFLENPTEENAQNAEKARQTWIDRAKSLGNALWSGGKALGKGALSLGKQLFQLLAKLLLVLGPSLAAGLVVAELIREAAAGAAENNSGCYMMITKGFDSTMDTTGLSCEKCLSGEDSWVRGMTQLQSCKYGNSKKTVLLVFSEDKDDADQYIKTGISDSGYCGNQVSASSDTINAFKNNRVYYIRDLKGDLSINPCTDNADNVVCVSNQGKHCQIDKSKNLGIANITKMNTPVVPLAQTADLSQPGADEQLAVFYQYKKFDTGDALNRFTECLGKCAKKTGTSMLWFIGILIGLFALYKFIEFEFDEHEGAIHARVKKD